MARIATREFEKAQRLRVDREERHGRAIFRRHIGDGRTLGQGKRIDAWPEILDEAPDHLLAP